MLTDDIVPRLNNGGIALCHICQRSVYFAGGFMAHLIKTVKFAAAAAEAARARKEYPAGRTALQSGER